MTMAKAGLLLMLLCTSLGLPIFLASRVSSAWMVVALLSITAAAHQGGSANLYTTAADHVPQERGWRGGWNWRYCWNPPAEFFFGQYRVDSATDG